MYKIFIAEDDIGIANSLSKLAQSWQMQAHIVSDFTNLLDEFSEYKPHIVLMDIGLPFFNGYHFCTEIRKISNVPIIFISSASDNMNIVMAMNMGADDFIAKPFDSNVLIAKIQALLRRSYNFTDNSSVFEYNGVSLNLGDGSVIFNYTKIELSKNEYRIFLCLLQNHGKIVSREKLMQVLWQTDQFVDENTLTVNVNRLRKKLSSAGLDDFIKTKFGAGYIVV